MKVVGISGSIVGSKTKTAMSLLWEEMSKAYPNAEHVLLDLADYQLQFSDGRNYLDYTGDTAYVTEQIMQADILFIGTPIFQASIPGTLKNVFDLLPTQALRDKVAAIIVTAGSARHFLVAEQQLKPILSYMKAHLVSSYVFAEEKDFLNGKIINDDVHFRLQRLIEDAFDLAEAQASIRTKKEAEYDF
ncbi:NADPH-dependent FMN reductase [Terribacillus saccharophilus]|uniref:FMN reductase n=1 Tax=Terribacillus saccharophilus TaxID=361277 RepID=A0A268ABA6_9BACI|nr:NADPH-dependent FMN reductase [Terribacillus saccharophilus]PAD21406.1 FMN reductase [Terribacillus saccharophilus]PAF16852.1 FMN reductase [Terribacillus saccharophilus]PAF20931.1 FMN reductase [Terribacillus saccharophilus]PAF36308.1 FMN reductase [Terribacillus saccharophilus]PAF39588.1 FMN reductase [Terribacillus saccharophilus]